jgi:hypothetical protein
MKFTYEFIRKNIEIYNLAKETIPSITQYENDEITHSAMRSLNLGLFADFCDFMRRSNKSGYPIIFDQMNWKMLKSILVEKTNNPRLKKFIKNRTQKQFLEILKDAETFDRLLNGRWLRKPKPTRRGRIGSGRRSEECLEGLTYGFLPLINFIIQNDVEVYQSTKVGYVDISNISFQEKYSQDIQWFTHFRLNLENVPHREIEVTNKLISQFVNILGDLKIDPRKLNLDYVTNTISERLKKGMIVPTGTNVKCLNDTYDSLGRKTHSKDMVYNVQGSYVSSGSVMIYIKNDLGHSNYVKYLNFEDMGIHRDNLLSNLFGD